MRIFNLLLIICLLGGCKNADDFQDVIYFTGTESDKSIQISVDENDCSLGLSITATKRVEEDVVASIGIMEDKLPSFNKSVGKNYKLLPQECYSLSDSEISILANNHVSTPIKLNISNTDQFEEGVTYCLPVSLLEVKRGELPILPGEETVYVIVNKTIVTTAPSLTGRSFDVHFEKDASLTGLSGVTMETRVYINSWADSWQYYISSVIGIEGYFLFRFGDGTVADQLQFCGDGQNILAPTKFETGKWYHIAAVYDGSNLSVYINGKLDISQPYAGPVDLTEINGYGGFYVGESCFGRYMDGYLSEARVWKRALSEKEIKNNMCYVDPTSPGLVAYWRFNEGDGRKIKDWTGNGWDLVAKQGDLTWIEGVRCPE